VVYAYNITILVGSLYAIKEDTKALVDASKEIELEVNADGTKYRIMSREQNAERSHRIKKDNISFQRVEQFICFGTTI